MLNFTIKAISKVTMCTKLKYNYYREMMMNCP